jgi:NADPH:quinone reductase-like Zn-dependent oxidoreductase
MSFIEGASVPVPFVAAYYGLVDLAGLKRGQTVLVNTATQYLGKAVITIAQRTVATITCTVANGIKRQVLVDEYNISESHICSYYNTDFVEGVMCLTGGKGADFVVNTLTDSGFKASWEAIAPQGTFPEFPKSQIYKRAQLDMSIFDQGARLIAVDLFILADTRPDYFHSLMRKVFYYFEAGHWSITRINSLPIGDFEESFNLIQNIENNIRVALTADAKTKVLAATQQLHLSADRTYVVVGGLDNVGRHIISHLQKRGARNIAIISRQTFYDETLKALMKDLADGYTSNFKLITCDVSDMAAVVQAASDIHQSLPPVAGVFHAAMVVAVCILSQGLSRIRYVEHLMIGTNTIIGPDFESNGT